MNKPAKTCTILLFALIVAVAPHAADATQSRAVAYARVISAAEVASVDSERMIAAAAAALPKTAGAEPQPQVKVTETDGKLSLSIDYN